MGVIALARHAMATRFEIVLRGENELALRGAGEEALNEIERLDKQLSLYQPASDISHINSRAAREWVRVEPRLFRLLTHARRLSEETGGAFDVTVAPLMRCWGFMSGSGTKPDAEQIAEAMAKTGMHLVEFDESNFSIRFSHPGVMLDLGAIGKGYAVEVAAEILRDAGVVDALLHGGTSTVCAIGQAGEGEPWKIAIEQPLGGTSSEDKSVSTSAPPPLLAVVSLRDESLSVSAVHGKSFSIDGKTFGHVIDPRSGWPAEGASLAAVVLPSATETDALSTALLTVGIRGHEAISRLRQGMRTLIAKRNGGSRWDVEARGLTTV